jgi:hypothetical protein
MKPWLDNMRSYKDMWVVKATSGRIVEVGLR